MCCASPIAESKRTLLDIKGVLSLLCGVLLAAAFGEHLSGNTLASNYLAWAAVAAGSYFAVLSMIEAVRARELDVNALMILATIGALIVGRPLEAAGLQFLFSLSGALESYAMAKTQNAIEALVRLRPDYALRVTENGEERVPVEALEIGDRVRIAPFETIPTDGVVEEGASSLNQAAMTGESSPVACEIGASVIGGTQNLEGLLLVRVTATVADSVLEKIVQLAIKARENKASGERISTWFGQRYTWFVLGAFAVSALVRGFALAQPWDFAFYQSLILLVALSPCALVLSIPASTLSATAYAARRGMLVRGGKFIELAGRIDALALDKTGTLTTGRFELVEICVCDHAPVAVGRAATCSERDACWKQGQGLKPEAAKLLAKAAAVEQYSSHPIAIAIVDAARKAGLSVPEADQYEVHPGRGITARFQGSDAAIGTMSLFAQVGLKPAPELVEHADALESEGLTVALMHGPTGFAVLGLRDTVRPNAKNVIEQLRLLGAKKVVMLTGDNEQTARSIAEETGVDAAYANLMPDDKIAKIDQLLAENASVLMVGDGVNDAPSLMRSTVGVAMGGLGSDIALNAADVVLMNDDLARIPELIALGRKTNGVIRANLIFAGGVIGVLAASSLFFALKLPWAVVGHEGSTLLVLLNALRLLGGPGLVQPKAA